MSWSFKPSTGSAGRTLVDKVHGLCSLWINAQHMGKS